MLLSIFISFARVSHTTSETVRIANNPLNKQSDGMNMQLLFESMGLHPNIIQSGAQFMSFVILHKAELMKCVRQSNCLLKNTKQHGRLLWIQFMNTMTNESYQKIKDYLMKLIKVKMNSNHLVERSPEKTDDDADVIDLNQENTSKIVALFKLMALLVLSLGLGYIGILLHKYGDTTKLMDEVCGIELRVANYRECRYDVHMVGGDIENQINSAEFYQIVTRLIFTTDIVFIPILLTLMYDVHFNQ
eukprot:NODE_440_length_7390_cov_0.787546.p5 type:complete len:246 gc:universal NODE_440_length_7390_cov_0.787546:3243-3980(+)